MFGASIRRVFFTGLTAEESPTLLQLFAGFCIRCFWFLIVSSFVASVCWCLSGTSWTADRREWLGGELRLQARSIILGEPTDVSGLPPSKQAAFWQQKTSELADADLDAEELMAAAIILNEPVLGYASQWMAVQLFDGRDIFESMEEAAIRYRKQLGGRSSQFAAKAVRDEPDNAELRRIQAMLLFPYSHGSAAANHCEAPNWLDTLKTSRAHDPDNALYDYLIAAHAWNLSTDIVYKHDPFMSCEVINDRVLYELAAQHFEQAQDCRILRFPDSEMQLVLQFCQRIGLQREASRIACCSEFQLESLAVLKSLNYRLEAQADLAQLVGDPEHLIAIEYQRQTLARQLEGRHSGLIDVFSGVLTAQVEATFQQIRFAHPELVADVSQKTLKQLHCQFKRDRQIETEISLRLLKKLNVDAANQDDGTSMANAVRPLIFGPFLLFISVGTYLVQKRTLRHVAPYRLCLLTGGCLLISLVGWTISLALLPSGIVKGGIPGATFIIGAEFVFIAGLIWLVRGFWLRRQEVAMPPPVRLRFIVPFVAVLVLLLQAVLWSIKSRIDDQFQPEVSGFAGLPIPTGNSLPEWVKVIVYWQHHHVLAISLVTGTLLTITFVSLLSWRWKKKTGASLTSSMNYFCGSCCAAFLRPALASGLILCSIGLASTPSAINHSLAWERYRELWCNRDANNAAETKIRAEVIRDTQFMKSAEAAAVAHSIRIPDNMEDCYLRSKPVSPEPD